jgi:hypothetical protein
LLKSLSVVTVVTREMYGKPLRSRDGQSGGGISAHRQPRRVQRLEERPSRLDRLQGAVHFKSSSTVL